MLSVLIAWSPAIRMTRLTTRASTGRRMKMSVNDFTYVFGGVGLSFGLGAILLSITTDAPLRNLKTPVLAT